MMPPTPQQSFSHIQTHLAPNVSPQHMAAPPNGMSAYGRQPQYSMSFDGVPPQMNSATVPTNFNQSFPNGPMSNPGGYARSFGEGMQPTRAFAGKPQIYTAVYSGVSVYEMEVGGIACMRRRSDGWLNATQILKIAGVDKGKRTKVLEKEILTGEHEKVQGGYGKYQGTWISYQRGREFCRQYGVEDVLRPLLDYDIQADGSGGQGLDTPTKEQAMAAQRKRFYTSNQDARPNGPVSNGTFFSNISSTTSVALAAMNKAARLNSPAPRPASAQKPSLPRQASQQDNITIGSQQSIASDLDAKADSGYSTQRNTIQNGEPPRKRMRTDTQDDAMAPPGLPLDASMRSTTPTEPNESFFYDNALMQEAFSNSGDPVALPPLPSPSTESQQEKMNLILDLFAESSRTDYASHAALTQLSNEDLNMPLDASANNALHWAATLAKVPLLKLLIQRGASIWRGNAAGQSPLVSAVLVNNCWEHSCFPEVLELLGPLIEVRDLQGRTILHHIGVSSGIKGRAPSSKYYLEALLEFLVRVGTRGDSNADAASQDTTGQWTLPRAPVSLSRFLSHIVNARDKAGNTALNLVARIGNRSIIQQLLEIHADPRLPNNKNICAQDFGVGMETGGEQAYDNAMLMSSQMSADALQPLSATQTSNLGEGNAVAFPAGSQVEELGQDVIASMTSMLTQNLASHKELLRAKSEQIDQINEQIRELSAMQKLDLENVQALKDRARHRAERRAQIANLRREINERRSSTTSTTNKRKPNSPSKSRVSTLSPNPIDTLLLETDSPDLTTTSTQTLQSRIAAYTAQNSRLRADADQLRSRSVQSEALYRKLVALCTGVGEARVEQSLPALVAAVESERGSVGPAEVGRIREFLRRVDSRRDEGGGGEGIGGMGLGEVGMSEGPFLMVNPTITAAAERAEAERRLVGRVR